MRRIDRLREMLAAGLVVFDPEEIAAIAAAVALYEAIREPCDTTGCPSTATRYSFPQCGTRADWKRVFQQVKACDAHAVSLGREPTDIRGAPAIRALESEDADG